MMYLMRAGGWSMWMILLFGLIALVTAVLFSVRPTEGKLGFVRGMSMATVFAVLAGVASDLAATFKNTASLPDEEAALRPVYAMMGVSESMSPAILGFAVLGVVWLITAAGIRRLADTP